MAEIKIQSGDLNMMASTLATHINNLLIQKNLYIDLNEDDDYVLAEYPSDNSNMTYEHGFSEKILKRSITEIL